MPECFAVYASFVRVLPGGDLCKITGEGLESPSPVMKIKNKDSDPALPVSFLFSVIVVPAAV
jgi:hypothetical protein